MLNTNALADLIETSGVAFKQNTRSYILDCPRCLKRDKLYIDRNNGSFVCWLCRETEGFKGRAEYALAEIMGLPISEVKAKLYGLDPHRPTSSYLDILIGNFFGDDDIIDSDAVEIPRITWPHLCRPIDHRFSAKGRAYLEGRGVPASIALEYDIRYNAADRRVYFPVKVAGRLVGYQARLIVSNEWWDEEEQKTKEVPKILSSAEIPRDQTLMFGDRLQGMKHAVLCEGPVDALKAHFCGGNVATMGKAVARSQIAILRNAGIETLYLALDPDAAIETTRLVREFSDLEVRIMHPPKGYKDLGEMSMEDVREVFLAAPVVNPGHFFLFLRGRS
jgi:hypothetical protein